MASRVWVWIFIIVVCVAGAISFLLLVFLGAFQPEVGVLALGDKVGLVEVAGTITNASPVVDEIIRFTKDTSIKAIVVRVESPGGIVAAAQEIYSELKKAGASGKPIVASLGGVAASGGYYVACGADSIVANPGTLTGSIGVIMTFPNTQELFKKLGISVEVVKTGEYKDLGNIARPMTDSERDLVGALIGDVYDQFVSMVAEERGLEIEAVEAFADGRLLTGRQAYSLGLVDKLGDFRDAVLLAGEMAGISGEPTVVKRRKRAVSVWDLLSDLTGLASKIKQGGVSLEYSIQ